MTVREELKTLRRRRTKAQQVDSFLAKDIRAVVKKARKEMNTTEIANLLGIERSNLYRTYIKTHSARRD